MVQPKFKAWIHRQLFDPRTEGICIRLSVRHVNATKQGQGDVDSIEVPKPSELEESFIELAAVRLMESAQQDANGLTGVQSYVIVSFFETDPTRAAARFAIRLQSEIDEDGSEDPSQSEPANKTGMLSQAMRHTEALMRMATQGAQQTINSMQRAIQDKDMLIAKLTEDRLETFKLVEELSSAKHEREMELGKEERNQKRQDAMLDKVSPLIPLIAAKITGTKLLSAGNGGEGVKSLLQSIDGDQFEKLAQILKPEQTTILAEMMIQIQQEESDKKGDSH